MTNIAEHDNTTFSDAERAAMRQRAEELKSQKGLKGGAKRQREFEACIAAIEALQGLDKTIAERFHIIVTEEAPHLDPKTWYGFPSYAANGKVITFLQPASKFDTRYATIGFTEDAALDDGPIWATSFALTDMTPEVEGLLRELVRSAASPHSTI